ncbi:MAG: DUF6263 family protein [Desulfotignum sp.]
MKHTPATLIPRLAFALLIALSLWPALARAQDAPQDPAALPSLADQPVSLRPQWEDGQTARYTFWTRTQKDEKAAVLDREQAKKTTFVTEGQMTWTVESVNDDGSAACTLKLDKIKFTITAADQPPSVIDSENPDGSQPVFEELVAAMVSTPLQVKVEADGTIAGVEGIEAMKNAAGQQAVEADMVPEEIDFIETASELATLISAPESATPGQTWNTRNTWKHDNIVPGTETFGDWDTTFTYASVGRVAGVPIATIKSTSDIDMKVDLSKLPEQSPDVDVQVQGATGRGEILFDLSRHETVARNDSMTYTATITVTPPNNRVPPININVTETSQSQLLRISEE